MVLGEMWHANFERPSNGGYQDTYDPPELLYHHGETDQPCDEMGFQFGHHVSNPMETQMHILIFKSNYEPALDFSMRRGLLWRYNLLRRCNKASFI